MSKGMSKSITQPVAGLTFLAMMAIGPSATLAQAPTQSPVPGVLPVPAQNTAPVIRQAPIPSNLPGNSTIPVPTETAQPPAAPVDYSLGGGDRIRINVFEVPEYTGEYQIPPGGELFLPLVGGVKVLGLTQAEAADAIAAKYSRYLKRPLITVSLISPRPINVIVAGEVNRPGSYTVGLQGGAGDNPGVQYPTIIGALTIAEGVSLSGDLRMVQLRRRVGVGQPERVTNIDLTQLVKTGSTSVRDITLRDGDTIFVPTSAEPNMAEIRQFATASFSQPPSQPRSVTVVGEVNRPGSYVITGGGNSAAAPSSPGNTSGGRGGGISTATIEAGGNAGGGLPTISRAIQLAGGITGQANVRDIQIRRQTKSGTEQRITANFWKLLQGDTSQDTIVQEGDTIIIPQATDQNPAEITALADASFSPATIQVSVVGEAETPGVVNIRPNTPLNQAILTAGGFRNARARKGSVELIRLNADGTATKRNIRLDFSQGINEKNNPVLRNNDIVVIRRNGAASFGDTVGSVFGPILSPFLGIFNLFR